MVAACSGSVAGGDGGSGDAGADAKKNPCEGLGCAIGPGRLVVDVKDDQTMAGIGTATFIEAGKALQPSCQVNQQMQCTGTYQLAGLAIGQHTIEVHAVGHAPKTLTTQVLGPTGCCGVGPDTNETVLLAPIDAKMLCTSTGGTVGMSLCCNGTSPFPSTCLTGACGCAPQSSTMIEVCQCPSNQCFDPEVGCKMR